MTYVNVKLMSMSVSMLIYIAHERKTSSINIKVFNYVSCVWLAQFFSLIRFFHYPAVCMHGQALQYLMDFCRPAFSLTSRQQLRFASRRLLVGPHCRLSTTGQRALSVAGPSVWNTLPDYLCDPAVDRNTFRQHLKSLMFASY